MLPTSSSVLEPRLERSTGLRPHLFRPPTTPSTSRVPFTEPGTDRGSFTNQSRKRSRPGSTDASWTTPHAQQADVWSSASTETFIARSADLASPSLCNTRYLLAGGLDTPTYRAAALEEERDQAQLGFEYGRRWIATDVDGFGSRNDYFPPQPLLSRERNGSARVASVDSDQKPGWGRFVLTMVGGVAGKMWDFCTAGAFGGFHAGGGQGYDIKVADKSRVSTADSWQDMDLQQTSTTRERDVTPIPGQYPDDEVNGAFAAQQNTPPRPSKRIHTGSGWVMVSHTTETPDLSPRLAARRTPSTNATPQLDSQRPGLKRSATSRPSNRRSLIPISRRTSAITYGGSPAVQPPKRHSLNVSRPSSSHASPISPEAQKFAERIARDERETDRSMRKLNSQLKAMIKQGKEALGTKFEIEDEEMEDEGFAEGL
ncbi:MAG: hypothetical protein M1820_002822 [Bogoriella megaspora]|nr:MAG: hypothetical protein M1820_002822 [Bogoriella megaspora]